jgi:hypothetical protein
MVRSGKKSDGVRTLSKTRWFRVDFQVLNGGGLLALGGTGKREVKFETEKVSSGKFRVKLPPLEKGEYAFLPPGTVMRSSTPVVSRMYTFGVR